jgi:hypothetical protein
MRQWITNGQGSVQRIIDGELMCVKPFDRTLPLSLHTDTLREHIQQVDLTFVVLT